MRANLFSVSTPAGLTVLIALTILALWANPSSAGGFCLPNEIATVTSPSGWILIVPDGTGTTLAEAGATVEIQLLDCGTGDPIAGYPFQDIWLDDIGNGDISLCLGGSIADANTDAEGRTTISGTITGGGYTQSGLMVYLAGVAVDETTLDIRVASPDLTGDLVVNIADLGPFAIDFWNQTNIARSDLTGDGLLDLRDIGEFAIHNGVSCP